MTEETHASAIPLEFSSETFQQASGATISR